MESTRREQISMMLQEHPWSVEQLARFFEVPIKMVVDDLHHVEKSMKASHRFQHHPPICQACDFTFVGRDKFHRPSRCPKCKSERILDGMVELIKR